ncbi:hypothetical protein LOTGIDRAFT_206927 [Lottia gigantea]|uniref:Poly [ADP-ribose] polymerase n=1 Tax=Lottia gigantea TaxID=225164 RepID=V4BHH9_LOTGI|nr:hypothetical protein LOTGIDRAFT_206927 [Lottia gigantea]ESO88129.1 hypothetical protein LOTGIDRAFT_206927 [Lottia gigantea]
MSDSSTCPFKAEYAKSDRSSCKACKTKIGKDSLRLAVMVQSPHFDGKVPNWFHYSCFWRRAGDVEQVDDIHGYHTLRWEDQQKLKSRISGETTATDDVDGKIEEHDLLSFRTEYAKSNRSQCQSCRTKIDQGEVRISCKEVDDPKYGAVDKWYHVDCFVQNRDELNFNFDVKLLPGLRRLKKPDQEELHKKLAPKSGKKRKADGAAGSSKKVKVEETDEEKLLRTQSAEVWKYRDLLQKNVNNQAMKLLLELNKQHVPVGESKLLDAMSDALVFGALEPCSECKDGAFFYTPEGYKCAGNMTGWTKCMNIVRNPKRRAFKIPPEFHDVEFLKKYKYKANIRVFPTIHVSSLETAMDSVDGAVSNDKPLDQMKFAIIGKTKKSKAVLTKEIANLGGTVVSKIDNTIAACISTKTDVAKKSKNVKEAEKADVHVVDEEFLDNLKSDTVVANILKHALSSWGSDPQTRIGDIKPKVVKRKMYKSGMSEMEEMRYKKDVPTKKKMTVKGGAAVDPDSELEDVAHVIQDDKKGILSVVLGLVDIVKGTNSFYKLQALEKDNNKQWYLFRSWGRVGTNIGGNKIEKMSKKENAIIAFRDLYLEKTGNSWEDRDSFVKHPNKFYPLEIDYGQEDEKIQSLDSSREGSKLPKPVQDVVCAIFDIDQMKKAMIEYEIDMKKMPLGKLSKRQIEQAYSVLTELNGLIEKKGSQSLFLDASNRFYTLIPHDFGMKKPPLLDDPEIIKTKTEMLDSLLEIEVAYNLLKSGDTGANPIDVHYKQLKCKMEPMEKKSEMYKRLSKYVKNTHATTHNQYGLEVLDIFEIDREGEEEKYQPFQDLHNRQLLWHGSRTTNYAGILSQGLRIAPPEAPVTGYMFGKGVYFADMVSKSANYCRTTQVDNVAYMLLCEVALGNTYDLLGSKFIHSLPKGKHSTKGCGMTAPDEAGAFVTDDGCKIPMGQGKDASIGRSSLLYNEYIVYDTSQIRMKYMLKMKFNYKW